MWKIYVFVRQRFNGRTLSRGKISSQVGHACMRLGIELGKNHPEIYEEYIRDGEKKIIFGVDNLYSIYDFFGWGEMIDTVVYNNTGDVNEFSVFVKDILLNEFTTFAVLSKERIDTASYKLL